MATDTTGKVPTDGTADEDLPKVKPLPQPGLTPSAVSPLTPTPVGQAGFTSEALPSVPPPQAVPANVPLANTQANTTDPTLGPNPQPPPRTDPPGSAPNPYTPSPTGGTPPTIGTPSTTGPGLDPASIWKGGRDVWGSLSNLSPFGTVAPDGQPLHRDPISGNLVDSTGSEVNSITGHPYGNLTDQRLAALTASGQQGVDWLSNLRSTQTAFDQNGVATGPASLSEGEKAQIAALQANPNLSQFAAHPVAAAPAPAAPAPYVPETPTQYYSGPNGTVPISQAFAGLPGADGTPTTSQPSANGAAIPPANVSAPATATDVNGSAPANGALTPGPSNTGTAAVPASSGNTPVDPNDPLTAQRLQVGPLADRFGIAQNKLAAFRQANEPAFQAQLRDAIRKAAAGGAIGSGQLQSSLGDVVANRANAEDAQGIQYLQDALSGSIGDQFAKTGIDQQQQQFQEGQQNTAFNQATALQYLQEALKNGQFNRDLGTYNAGNTGDPTSVLTALSQIFGGQASQAGGALGGLITNKTSQPGNNQQVIDLLTKIFAGQGGSQPPVDTSTP